MRVARAAATMAAALSLTSVVASPATATALPGATLSLSWSAPSVSNQVFTTTLTCSPAGGGEEWYLDPELACGDLAAAGGDFPSLPGRPLDCAGAGGPAIRFTATGTWDGHPVSYDRVHANWCQARRSLGRVATF
ncbi:SSI family serine proteinase inhibitor [Virgisporangium ochraceum]|nr:SSI family serine proteinase inhibitor [Virgisporangium ochraceum]